ncbi:MAG: methyltransferase domain-containing protein [Chloroflexi bacterium]|nr:methyltransferase domain-containing protein [Chloroflexota bacterium]
MSSTTYAFGNSDLAAERLRVLAGLFEPEIRGFLGVSAPDQPAVAVDLGCGPGHTTRLIADVVHPSRLVGLDASPRFVMLARAAAAPDTRFEECDLSTGALPVENVNMMFVRLLLTHLSDPRNAVTGWMRALAPTGVMLIDEVEEIETDNHLLQEYLGLADYIVASRGGASYIGPVVAGFGDIPGVSVRSSEVIEHEIPVAKAVEMFIMNFHTLRADPVVRDDYDALDAMGQGLRSLRGAHASERIVWSMRQMVLERSAG